MAASGIRTHHLWLPMRGETHTFVSYRTRTVLLCKMRSLRVIGIIRKRKNVTTELNIFLSKLFSTESNKFSHRCSLAFATSTYYIEVLIFNLLFVRKWLGVAEYHSNLDYLCFTEPKKIIRVPLLFMKVSGIQRRLFIKRGFHDCSSKFFVSQNRENFVIRPFGVFEK